MACCLVKHRDNFTFYPVVCPLLLSYLYIPTFNKSENAYTVGIAQWYSVGYGLNDQGFESRQGLEIFLLTTTYIPALGPTQPPIKWVPGALSLGVKRPGHEAEHSPPSSAEVKESVELYLHSHSTPSWRGAQLNTGNACYILEHTFSKWELDDLGHNVNFLRM
jgi:hypothetical protein